MNQREESHPNYIYSSCVKFFNLITAALNVINGSPRSTIWSIDKILDEKRRHIWATQVMNQLVKHSNLYKKVIQSTGETPDDKDKFGDVPDPTKVDPEQPSHTEKKDDTEDKKNDKLEEKKNDKDNKLEDKKTPILIAAKMGVSEMVETILDKFPVAIEDVDSENKNVALLAVENRQPHVYSLLVDRKKQITRLLRRVDNNGNNALHLAAKCGSHRPWLTPGTVLQMQWELKWYMFVKESLPPRSSVRYNKEGQIPQEIFTTSHKDLRKEGSDWLVKTSESCSVVAALIATVAFATSASVPGGLDDKTGSPVFKDKPAFNAFTISSLLALCLSVTALVFFLTIITSRYEARDFSISLPRKLLLGLTSLFASIAAVLVSFCTGHIFLLDRHLRHVAYPLYAATCLPVTIFALAQLSLYYDLIRVIFRKVPQRSYKEYRH
ncbi:ankyrin repeat-containing protein ITN1-like [Prunus dulcis]|nr:ankyrin repeat-containing protein ITN1-like [Prunus dulcis]